MIVQRGFKRAAVASTIDRLRERAGRLLLRRDHERLRRDVRATPPRSRPRTAGRSSPTSARCSSARTRRSPTLPPSSARSCTAATEAPVSDRTHDSHGIERRSSSRRRLGGCGVAVARSPWRSPPAWRRWLTRRSSSARTCSPSCSGSAIALGCLALPDAAPPDRRRLGLRRPRASSRPATRTLPLMALCCSCRSSSACTQLYPVGATPRSSPHDAAAAAQGAVPERAASSWRARSFYFAHLDRCSAFVLNRLVAAAGPHAATAASARKLRELARRRAWRSTR